MTIKRKRISWRRYKNNRWRNKRDKIINRCQICGIKIHPTMSDGTKGNMVIIGSYDIPTETYCIDCYRKKESERHD